MQLSPNSRVLFSILLLFSISLSPLIPSSKAFTLQRSNGQGDSNGQGNGRGDSNSQGDNRADPCLHSPDPSGAANGIHKRCAPRGSSSGIAKGDFNGDGFADLAIGEPGATINRHAGAGDVIVLYGSSGGLTTSGRTLIYEGREHVPGSPEAGDHFGAALASGDFNGDGFSDLAVGIPNKNVTTVGAFGIKTVHAGAGTVVIIYGAAGGLGSSSRLPLGIDLADFAHPVFGGPFSCDAYVLDGAHYGQSLAWGNFNGDKYGDLAVGSPGTNCPDLFGGTPPGAGAVFVHYGGPEGLTLSGEDADDLSEQLFFANDDVQPASFGAALAAGDFDGDGKTDLAVGAPFQVDFSVSQVVPAGGVFIFRGIVPPPGGSRFLDRHSFVLPNQFVGVEDGERFGSVLTSGDFDGDGKFDLAIGAPGKSIGSRLDAGVVTVLSGASDGSGLTVAGSRVWKLSDLGNANQVNETHAEFGAALAAGDFNADGKMDLAVGVPFKDITVTRNGTSTVIQNAGEVAIIYGSSAGLSISLTRTPQFWNQDLAIKVGAAHSGNDFGFSLTAWDFGKDDRFCIPQGCLGVAKSADLAIGAPFEAVNGIVDAGAVDVMYGSFGSNGLTGVDQFGVTRNTEFTADSVGFGSIAHGNFGFAVY